jgi:hypothetical protein
VTGSRRFWTRLAAFALAGVLLGALAAFLVRERGDSGPGEADAPTSPATLAAPATDRPTSAPPTQPSASDPPTAQPTELAATAAPTFTLATFVRHVGRAIKQGETLLTPLREAAQALDLKAVRADAAALSGWAATESAWLDRHPPVPCYADLHHAYGSAIDDFAEAAAITEQFAKDFPFADYDALQRAQDLAQSGSASMQGAVDRLAAVRC